LPLLFALAALALPGVAPAEVRDEVLRQATPASVAGPSDPDEAHQGGLEVAKGYWDKSREGWFWYEKILEERRKKEEERSRKEEEARPESPKAQPPPRQEITREYLDTLSVPDLRDLGDRAREIAVGQPTRENVFRYVYVQKYMVEKSEMFAKAWQVVLLEHPEMSDKETRGGSESSRPLVRDALNLSAKKRVAELSDNAALLFFFDPDCPYCQREERILVWFEEKNNWYIKRINIRDNPDLAERFGVEEVPDMWILYKNPDGSPFYYRVRAGYLTLDEIEESISFLYEHVIMNPEINKNGPGKDKQKTEQVVASGMSTRVKERVK